ncbi:MAG: STAS domain-containing protein [Bacteroidales bacterium]|nr:STAS domain-containing protein [Bacteroidales bacterium]
MLKLDNIGNVMVVSFNLDNKINVTVSQKIKVEVTKLITPHSKLVMNLEGINYIDSTGFGMLLSILRTCKTNQSLLKLCNISPEVMELVKLLQLQTVFDIRNNLDDCLKSFD